jgi:outer membrane protein
MPRNLYAFALATLMLAISTPIAQAQVKIGVVDIQRAIMETEDGRTAKARLKRLFDERQKTLDAKQEALKTLKEDLERQRNVLSQEAMQKKLESYQQSFQELQGIYVEYQRELGAQEGELTKHIVDRMQEILKRIGQTEGYTLIMERGEGGVIWVPGNLDLTDSLIQRYNAESGKKSDNRSKNAAKKR